MSASIHTSHQRDDARPAVREWLSAREACELIGVSPATLRRWSDAGDLRTFTTPGGHRRFSRASVMGLVATPGGRPGSVGIGDDAHTVTRVYRRRFGRASQSAPWVASLDDAQRAVLREHGRALLAVLVDVLDAATSTQRGAAASRARSVATAFGHAAASCGVATQDTVAAFLAFRRPLLGEIAAIARRRGMAASAAMGLLLAATDVLDDALLGVLAGHEGAPTASCSTEVEIP